MLTNSQWKHELGRLRCHFGRFGPQLQKRYGIIMYRENDPISKNSDKMYKCNFLSIDFQKETVFQFLSLLYPKIFVSTIWSVVWKLCLQKVLVEVVFSFAKVVSKFYFGHFLNKRWKVEFGFRKSIVKIILVLTISFWWFCLDKHQ